MPSGFFIHCKYFWNKTMSIEQLPHHREETINTLLAISLAHYGLMAEAEIISNQGATRKSPDVFFQLDGLDVVLEGKFERKGAMEETYAQIKNRMIYGLAHIAIAIIYPETLRTTATTEVENALKSCSFRYLILTEAAETDWLEGDLTKFVSDIRQSQTNLLENNLVETLAASLGETLFNAARMWSHEFETCEKFSTLLGIYPPSSETEEETKKRHNTAAKVAGLVLANALIFQEQLRKTHKRVKPIQTFFDVKQPEDMLVVAQEHWNWIWNSINYVPIFQLAENVLECIPRNSPSRRIPFKSLIRQANDISSNQAALRHDLMGRIYHWLLHEAKFLGTFYTSVPTATLLLKLAISLDKNRDFSEIKTLKNYRVADLSCGTGTLLMAASNALRDVYIRQRISKEKTLQPEDMQAFHKVLMEKIIFGYDVLPSAVHLTASTLALLAPEVAFGEMNLFVMPLGMNGSQACLGSLDFLESDKVETQFSLVSDHLQSSQESAATSIKTNAIIPSEKFDLCVMNPPFVRSVGGNLLFGSLPDERNQLQTELKKRVKNVGASTTAGLGSVFVALANKHLKIGGRMAFVLPAALASGEAWAETRELLATYYHLEIVVSSHDPERPNFSENTDLSEILFIARKLFENEIAGDTLYLNLWHNPNSIYRAQDIAIRALQTPTVALKEQGICSLKSLVGKMAETFTMSPAQQTENWTGALFAQTDLLRIFCQLKQDHILAIPSKQSVQLSLCQLQELGSLGYDRRDIHDAFNITTDEWSPYSAFWGHNSKQVICIQQQPNGFLYPRSIAAENRRLKNPQQVWAKAGNILLVERVRFNSHKLLSVSFEKPVLGNTWWAFKPNSDDWTILQQKSLLLWLNSSIAITLVFGCRVITEGAWVQLKKPAWEKMPILDVRKLEQKTLKKLAKAYDKLKEQELQAIAKLDQDKVRKAIDDALSDALQLPDLSLLRELLARESGLTGKGLFVPISNKKIEKTGVHRK
jgi:hypothetical protein